MKKYDLEVLSLGAGVQSSVIALMIEEKELPPIDFAVFADTGAEPRAVYEWLDHLETLVSFPIHRVKWKNLTEAMTEEAGIVQGGGILKGKRSTIPAFTTGRNGRSRGQLMRTCTMNYKVIPITKFIREQLGVRKGHRVKSKMVRRWMGISFDEIQRYRDSSEKWADNFYPLIEKRMHRHQCLEWMESRGYPEPPRSACTYCPYHSDREWRRLRDNDPEGWAEALDVDKRIRAGLGTTTEELFLHSSLIPLEDVDLRTDIDKGQMSLFDDECAGICGV